MLYIIYYNDLTIFKHGDEKAIGAQQTRHVEKWGPYCLRHLCRARVIRRALVRLPPPFIFLVCPSCLCHTNFPSWTPLRGFRSLKTTSSSSSNNEQQQAPAHASHISIPSEEELHRISKLADGYHASLKGAQQKEVRPQTCH